MEGAGGPRRSSIVGQGGSRTQASGDGDDLTPAPDIRGNTPGRIRNATLDTIRGSMRIRLTQCRTAVDKLFPKADRNVRNYIALRASDPDFHGLSAAEAAYRVGVAWARHHCKTRSGQSYDDLLQTTQGLGEATREQTREEARRMIFPAVRAQLEAWGCKIFLQTSTMYQIDDLQLEVRRPIPVVQLEFDPQNVVLQQPDQELINKANSDRDMLEILLLPDHYFNAKHNGSIEKLVAKLEAHQSKIQNMIAFCREARSDYQSGQDIQATMRDLYIAHYRCRASIDGARLALDRGYPLPLSSEEEELPAELLNFSFETLKIGDPIQASTSEILPGNQPLPEPEKIENIEIVEDPLASGAAAARKGAFKPQPLNDRLQPTSSRIEPNRNREGSSQPHSAASSNLPRNVKTQDPKPRPNIKPRAKDKETAAQRTTKTPPGDFSSVPGKPPRKKQNAYNMRHHSPYFPPSRDEEMTHSTLPPGITKPQKEKPVEPAAESPSEAVNPEVVSVVENPKPLDTAVTVASPRPASDEKQSTHVVKATPASSPNAAATQTLQGMIIPADLITTFGERLPVFLRKIQDVSTSKPGNLRDFDLDSALRKANGNQQLIQGVILSHFKLELNDREPNPNKLARLFLRLVQWGADDEIIGRTSKDVTGRYGLSDADICDVVSTLHTALIGSSQILHDFLEQILASGTIPTEIPTEVVAEIIRLNAIILRAFNSLMRVHFPGSK